VFLVTGITTVALGLRDAHNAPAQTVELVDHIVGGHEGVAIRHAVRGLGSEDGRSELRNLAFVHEGNHACIIEPKSRGASKKWGKRYRPKCLLHKDLRAAGAAPAKMAGYRLSPRAAAAHRHHA
jgi:hypothetical protein